LTFTHLAVSSSSVVDSFDETATGALPSGWSQARSDNALSNPPTFTVAAPPTGISALSAGRVLASTVPSGHVATRAWVSGVSLADVQVSPGIYVNSPTQLQILARGGGLDTAAPTYYALTLTQGSPTHLQLQKTVDGITTTLPGGDLSFTYISKVWVE